MDSQDKSEARAEYRNARQTTGGKGDVPRGSNDGPIWCEHGRFKDKCKRCL